MGCACTPGCTAPTLAEVAFRETKLSGGGNHPAMFDLAHDGDISRLTLNRPEARNAIPASGWARMDATLAEAEASGAKVLIVRGAGPAFCAGADLDDFAAMRAESKARTRFR